MKKILFFICILPLFAFRPGPKPALANIVFSGSDPEIIGLSAFIIEDGDSFFINQTLVFQCEDAETISIYAPHMVDPEISITGNYEKAEYKYIFHPGKSTIEIRGKVSTLYAVAMRKTSWESENIFAMSNPLMYANGRKVIEIPKVLIVTETENFHFQQGVLGDTLSIDQKLFTVFKTSDVLQSGEKLRKRK